MRKYVKHIVIAAVVLGAAVVYGSATTHADAPCDNVIGELPCDAPPPVTVAPPTTVTPPTSPGCTNVPGQLPCDAPPPVTVAPPSTVVPPLSPGCKNVLGKPPCTKSDRVLIYRCTVSKGTASAACASIPGAWNDWKGRVTPPRWDPCGPRGPFTLLYFLPCGPMTPTIKQWCTLHFDHRYPGDPCGVRSRW